MILIFDPDSSLLKWCQIDDGHLTQNTSRIEPGWVDTVKGKLGNTNAIKAIAYVLHHGGDEIDEPVSLLSREPLGRLRECIRFLPEHNALTYKASECWLGELPRVPHVLLCDTAFFVSLSAEASTYAVPHLLRTKGAKRYGAYGLCHQWAWEQTRALAGVPIEKLVSVYLGERTNIAAVKDGRAEETTIGFTPVEGIPSCTSCGDVDPTVVFQLESTGMSFEDINQLLSSESGFSGLLGRKCSFVDLLQRDDAEKAAAREFYRYTILKHIGAFVAVLGGVDAIVFVTKHVPESLEFMMEICERLGFLGLECQSAPEKRAGCWYLSSCDSPIKAVSLKHDKWETLAYMTRKLA